MRVELDEKGCLAISAETAVESFALNHWYSLWREKQATLLVQVTERARDGSGAVDKRYQPVETDPDI